MNRFTLDNAKAGALLPRREQNSNKGTFGKVLLICGSKNMLGCAVLSAKGALRSGAGLVTAAFPDCLYNPMLSKLTEPVFLPLKTSADGTFCEDDICRLLKRAEESDAVLCGCGIGLSNGTKLLVQSLVSENETPLILDADALTLIAKQPYLLKNAGCPVLLTPHPGEMSRICRKSIADIESAREKTCLDFVKEYNVNLLLKGHRTLVLSADGNNLYENTVGNSGLAKGGSGDFLGGIIAGLTPSLDGDLFKSACLGAYLHGLTSEILCEEMTEYAMLPSDCADAIPRAFKTVLSASEN